MKESETKKNNRKQLTEYWEARGVKLAPGETIDDYIVVPGEKTDWAFYPLIEWFKKGIKNMLKPKDIIEISKQWFDKEYWTKVNVVEAWAFGTKIAIIFPGLLFGKQFWWLYVFALASSFALVLTSTIKTLPTIIWFNICWIVLATLSIVKHFIN